MEAADPTTVVKSESAAPSSDSPQQSQRSSSSTPAAEKTENGSAKRGGWPKGKKRKKPLRDQTAPRQPLTGYVRFLNDHRERVRAEKPSLPFSEITRLLGGEWSNLPANQKQQYLTAAEQDRERYLQEMNAYKQTEAYRIFTQRQAGKKVKEEHVEEEPEKESEFAGFDIPIFTEEFLDHNKGREAELRQLRKSNTDYEQQNAILQQHMETMRAAVDKLTVETHQQRNNNAALHQHLHHLRVTLAAGFANTPLPGNSEVPTLQTIDSYMSRLHTLLTESSNQALASSVRDIVSRLEFHA